MDADTIRGFQETVWEYYRHHGRHDMPWRQPESDGSFDPYKIMVSELMLQQTQVSRVVPKYAEFLERFPSVQSLAAASLGDVLIAWNGLGYNRRAKFLWQAAGVVVNELNEVFPSTSEGLQALPGVGANTAGAILAYAFNQDVVFVETNVRTVIIHHFFADVTGVDDRDIRAALEQANDHEHPREWHWALMDYGSYLKRTVGNLSTASKHYARQSRFEGSRRQVRGAVLRALGRGGQTLTQLSEHIADERLGDVLGELCQESMIRVRGDKYYLH